MILRRRSSEEPNSERTCVSRLVKEPLFHFLILGLAIYAGYAWLNPG